MQINLPKGVKHKIRKRNLRRVVIGRRL